MRRAGRADSRHIRERADASIVLIDTTRTDCGRSWMLSCGVDDGSGERSPDGCLMVVVPQLSNRLALHLVRSSASRKTQNTHRNIRFYRDRKELQNSTILPSDSTNWLCHCTNLEFFFFTCGGCIRKGCKYTDYRSRFNKLARCHSPPNRRRQCLPGFLL